MKKLILLIAAAGMLCAACNSSDDETTWDKYREWRELNNSWLAEMEARTNDDGTPYYTKVSPDWNPGAYVLMHYFNDPAENADKLSPIYTSTVDVIYNLHLYNGTPADSSTTMTQYGPGVFRTRLNEVIQGWAMGVTQMHCGDTVELIVPYGVAYGSQVGTLPPYSNLRFNIRLKDIYRYEATPY